MMSYSCAMAVPHPPLPQALVSDHQPGAPGGSPALPLPREGAVVPQPQLVPAPGCGPGALKAPHIPLATARGFKDLLKQPCPCPPGSSHGGNLSNVTRAKGDTSGCSTKNSRSDLYFLSVFHELMF